MSNTTGVQISVQLKASYDVVGQTAPRTVNLPVAPFASLETRILNFSDYVSAGLIPPTVDHISLELSHSGSMGDLSMQIFSLDRTGNFVFGAEARAGATFRNDAIYWSTQGNENTMLAVQNVSDAEVAVRVTLSYNDGQGRYKVPLTKVPAHAARSLNFKQIISAGQPDEDGNLIPATTDFGTARIEVADGQPLARIVVNEGVFDPVAGTCGSGCVICGVVVAFNLLDNPTAGTVGTTKQVSASVDWSDGSSSDVTHNTSFSSSNSTIISVQNIPGQTGNGMASFNTVGTVNIHGSISVRSETDDPPPICRLVCPLLFLTALIPGDSLSITVSLSPISVSPQAQSTVTVTVLPAQSGRSVTLQVQEAANSGGHQHIGRPLGTFGSASGTTDAGGNFRTIYTASLSGGSEIVLATTTGGLGATASLTVLVPGLSQLASGVRYNLVGATATHPSNHFGTSTLNAALAAVADQYFASFSERLSYNDMSLIQGGLFDISANWTSPHAFHREGRNCDINPAPLSADRDARLRDIVTANGGTIQLDCVAGCNYHTTF